MRNLSFCGCKWDKRFFLAFLITLGCAIICGIVLYKPVLSNVYFRNLTCDYVYNVFNFKTVRLCTAHVLGDILYLYIFFLICYFTKYKYLTLILLYLRGLFFGIYVSIMIGANSFSGIIVAVFVFIPASLVSFVLSFLVCELCKCINKRYAFALPAIFAAVDCLVLILLINVLFRVVIAIV